jgi:hypothetical protein
MSALSQIDTHSNRELERRIEQARRLLALATNSMVDENASFERREQAMLQVCNEMTRRNLRDDLQTNANKLDVPYLLVGNQLYKKHSSGKVHYHSLCGSFRVQRSVYRKAFGHNAPTVVPMELSAGIIYRATPALARRVALGDAQCPGRQWEQQLRASHRAPPSRSTLERMAKAIGSRAKADIGAIEPLVRSVEKLPEQVHAISIGLDRTTIPMEELRPDNTAPDASRRKREKPYKRKAPPRVEVNYRMAYVGTVTLLDSDAEPVNTFRYAASADDGPDNVVRSIMSDVEHAQQQRRHQQLKPLEVGIVQDGAAEMWQQMRTGLSKYTSVTTFYETIDIHHLTERLAESLSVLPMQKVDKQRVFKRWRHNLPLDDKEIDRVEKFLQKQLRDYFDNCKTRRTRVRDKDYVTVRDHLKYIKNHKDKMRYATVRKEGFSIASGATEGACKSTVSVRAKGCGQRWHSAGVNSVLTLRSYYMSDRFDSFWSVFKTGFTDLIAQAA